MRYGGGYKGGVRGGYKGGGRGGGYGGVWRFTHRRCTQRAVHAQGGAHKRRSVATAGVLLFKRRAKRAICRVKRAQAREGLAIHTQGDAHTRRFVATTGVLLFKGGGCGGSHLHRAKQAEAREGLAVHTQGNAHTKRCTHKAVHTKGGL